MTSPSTRFRVLERDGFRCRYCGRSADDGAVLHVDHIHPRAHGGAEDMDNLVTACYECNIGKGARLMGVTEQPVIFRGRSKERKRRRRYRATVPEEWAEGSHCSTPLKVAALGLHMGKSTYRDAWVYLNGLEAGLLPPHRMDDAFWYRWLIANESIRRELSKDLVDSLQPRRAVARREAA